MAKINYDYYSGNDIYNDGVIEEELLNYYKNNTKLDLFREDTFYITTYIRKNILNWYPFEKNSDVLEIGAGMGTITEMLCDNCGTVTSVESSKRRTEVLYERCKQKKNLNIYAANIQDIPFKEKFDYVILIGVFEYSKIFFDTENPFADHLNYLKKLLKQNGKILIAIENRLGFKYIYGSTEDHYAERFVGLKGYETSNIQTLGKKEWIDLLNECNIKNYKFYYPFPDYKMPSVIYTDKRLPLYTETNSIPIFNYDKGEYIEDYRKTINSYLDNNLFSEFSNSYLIEIGNDDTKLSSVVFAKIQNKRSELFRNITTIYEDGKIEKIPVSNKNIGLDELLNTHNKLKELNVNICEIKKEKDIYEIENVENAGELFSEYIYKLIKSKGINSKNEIVEVLNSYYLFLKSISYKDKITKAFNDDINKVYKEETNILKIGLLDMNCSNVFYDNKKNKFTLIDQELYTDKQVPLDYIMYFSIDNLYNQINTLNNVIEKEELLKNYNITKSKIKVFISSGTKYFKDLNYFDESTAKYINEHSNINIIDDVISSKEIKIKDLENKSNILENYKTNIDKMYLELMNEHTKMRNLYEETVNSKGYKMMDKVRNIKNKIVKK